MKKAALKEAIIIATLMALFFVLIRTKNLTGIHEPWEDLTTLYLLRLAITILYTSFVPGYLILSVLFWRSFRKRSKIEQVLYSYVTSTMLVSFVGFALVVFGFPISDYGPTLVLSISGLLTSIFVFICYFDVGKEYAHARNDHSTVKISKTELFILITVGFFAVSITFVENTTFILFDQYSYHGFSQVFLRGNFPSSATGTVYPSLPYWFGLFVAMLTATSGVPSVNVYMALAPLNFMYVLAYYLMVSSALRKRFRWLPSLSLIFLLFAGLGWLWIESRPWILYSIDIHMSTSLIFSAFPTATTNVQLMALPAFFMLVHLLTTKSSWSTNEKAQYYFLLTTAFVLSYLSHMVEFGVIVLFVLVSWMASFMAKKPEEKMGILLSALLAMLVVLIVDITAPAKFYVFGGRAGSSSVLFIGLATLLVVSSFFSLKPVNRFGTFLRMRDFVLKLSRALTVHLRSRRLKIGLLILMCYLYFLCFVAIDKIALEYETTPIYYLKIYWPYETTLVVPIVFYPIMLGINGIFAVAALAYFLFRKKQIEGFGTFYLLAAIFFVFGRLNWFSPIVQWPEHRFIKMMAIMLAPPSALIFGKLLFSVHEKFFHGVFSRKKRFFGTFVLFLVVIVTISSGVFTSIYHVDYWKKLATEEDAIKDFVDGFEEISERIDLKSESIATLGELLGYRIHKSETATLIGHQSARIPPKDLLKESFDPISAWRIISDFNIRYVYMRKLDEPQCETLTSSSYPLFIWKYLPIEYEDAQLTIRSLPQLPSYEGENNVTFLMPSPYGDFDFPAQWKEFDFSEDWRVDTVSNVSEPFVNFTKSGLVIEGEFHREGLIKVFSTQLINIDTTVTPLLEVEWKSPQQLATIWVGDTSRKWYNLVKSASSRVFTTSIFQLPENVTIDKIALNADLRGVRNGAGKYSVIFKSLRFIYHPARYIFLPSSFLQFSGVGYNEEITTSNAFQNSEFIVFPWDPNDLPENETMEFLSNGGCLVVFNTLGEGFFSKLMNNISASDYVHIKDTFNDGEIHYFDLCNDVDLILENQEDKNAFDIFNSTLSSLRLGRILPSESSQGEKEDPPPYYTSPPHINVVRGGIRIEGTSTVEANLMRIRFAGDEGNGIITLYESAENEKSLLGTYPINDMDITIVGKATIETTSPIDLSPSLLNNYVLLYPEAESQLQIQFDTESQVRINGLLEEYQNMSFLGDQIGSIDIRLGSQRTATIIASCPKFFVDGSMEYAADRPMGWNYQTIPMQARGYMQFGIRTSTTSTIILSNFTTTGDLKPPEEYTKPKWNELTNVPWMQTFLSSPGNYLTVGFISATAIILIYSKIRSSSKPRKQKVDKIETQ